MFGSVNLNLNLSTHTIKSEFNAHYKLTLEILKGVIVTPSVLSNFLRNSVEYFG